MSRSKEPKVFFFSYDIDPNLRDRKRLKDFIESIFKKEGKKLDSINYIFCSDFHLLKINREFLKHDFYTDILTFDLSDDPLLVKADVFISVDRIRDNAKKLGVSIRSELHRVIFHGVLHLCGYGDKTSIASMNMRNKENKYLRRYFD